MHSSEDALDYLGVAEYDAIILDIMLPGMNGLELCRPLRARGNQTPTLPLTVRDAVEDRVTGFDAGAGDDERPITGDALERASDAALEYTGQGEVTDTEIGVEEGYYEVEVTLDDGTEIDVHLDENFNVLHTEEDGPGEDDN